MSGCEIYRISLPLYRLGETAGFETVWMPMDLVPMMGEKILGFDVYILPRLWSNDQNVADMMKAPIMQLLVSTGKMRADTQTPVVDMLHAFGKKVVYEVDDDFTNHFRVVHGGGEGAIKVARACDAVIVSTPYLQTLMEEETGRPVFLCRNYIEPAHFARPSGPRQIPGLTIGVTGSHTHEADWRVLEEVLPSVLEKYPQVTLVVGGYLPDYFPQPSDRVVFIPWADYAVYTETLRQMDIILAPVDPNDFFNMSKSPIKALEGMAAERLIEGRHAGAAVIATDMPVYRDAIDSGYNGLLVKHTPQAWEHGISSLIEDVSLRTRIARNGHRWVNKNRSIHTGWQDWRKAIRAIVSQEAQ